MLRRTRATLDTDKCEQVWADLERAAFQLEEAVKSGKSADIPALMAMAVRRAKAEFAEVCTKDDTKDENMEKVAQAIFALYENLLGKTLYSNGTRLLPIILGHLL